MKNRDLAALLYRAAAALETPADLTAGDKDALIADLTDAGFEYESMDAQARSEYGPVGEGEREERINDAWASRRYHD